MRLREDESSYPSSLYSWRGSQEFLNGVYKVLSVVVLNSWYKEKLALYKLRDVSQVW